MNLSATNLEYDDILADFHNSLNRWKTDQLLYVHRVNVMQTKIHFSEPKFCWGKLYQWHRPRNCNPLERHFL